jgi:serine/threonine protein kinase/pimeloyl-ACP methyl ester carboxylesterase/Tfp pilus assembly protein PilF
MEQQIRYCTTSDSVRIAYAIVGEGPPVVRVVGWFSHLEYELKSQYWSSILEVIGSQYLYVRYDGRGMGLSDRHVSDFSLEAHVRDLEAVIDSAGIERFGLDGLSQGGPTAITYAVRHPERVTHLVLYGSYARPKPAGLDLDTDEGRGQFDAMLTLMRHGWGSDTPAFRQMFTGLFMPDADGDSIREFNEMQRTSTSAETAATLFAEMMEVDVTDLLPKVSVPTLVIHRKGDAIVPFERGRELATTIPGARFLPVEGNNHAILPHEPELLVIGVEMDNFRREVLEAEEERRQAAGTGSEAQSSIEKDLIGRTLSRYQVLKKLGEGGMGVVYKAEDITLKRPVALKFLPLEFTESDEAKERFIREAQAAAALDHPNICTTYEIAEAEGQTFIAMAYVDGETLSEKIELGPLKTHEVLNITIQVAEGLRKAHRKGIIHRDIKSANIMLDEEGQAKIMDFGLAKLAGQTRLTKTATIMGTVAYMSPEQARGETSIDHHTDIWSLGVVLYEMLSGKVPFDAPSDAALLHKIIYEPEEPIGNVRQDLPLALEQAVLKMLQKDPRNRYEDMEALLYDLESIKTSATPITVEKEKTTPSIAILPFVDMSPQRDQEYFCDGMAEALINELTHIEDLKVIARTSAFSFKGKNVNVRDIGRELDVGTILEGSVQKAGNRLRITAQLISTAKGHHLWSERFDREMEDIFAIQDEITLAIVDMLKPKLLGTEQAKLARRQTVNLEAYNLYLRGRWFWNKMTKEGLEKAIEYFEQATEKEPNYAPAHTGVADSYLALSFWGFVPSKDVRREAKRSLERALEIDETLSETHTSLAMMRAVFEWDWPNAEREIKRAIELNPSYATAHHMYAALLMFLARFDEAIEEIKQALELDPLSLFINRDAGQFFLIAHRHEEAMETLQRAIEMDWNFSRVHSFLGLAYLSQSMYEEALAEFQIEEEVAEGWDPPTEGLVGTAYALMGKTDEAQQIFNHLVERSKQEYVSPFVLALFHLALGDDDQGFEWLDRAYEERDLFLCFLKMHPLFDILNVRSDPRYVALLEKIGLDK